MTPSTPPSPRLLAIFAFPPGDRLVGVGGPAPTGAAARPPTGIGHRRGQRDIETGLGPVAVHRRQQDRAGTVIDEPPGPFDRVEPGGTAPAMGEDAPFAGRDRFRVNR